MNDLTIDKEFAGLCPNLTPEEVDLLEASITTDGCRDPIIVWANHDNTILDGHNRYRICKRFDVPFKIKALKFDDREAVVNWIISNQLGRRNLSEEQKEYLRGRRYHAEKKTEGRPEKRDHNDPVYPERTSEKLAKEYNVSPATIKRDAKFSEAVDKIDANVPDAKASILSGKSGLSKKDVVAIAELPPKQQGKAIKAGKPLLKHTETHIVTDAMSFATMAISQLERIKKDDPKRHEAFVKVEKWIQLQREKS